MSPAETLERIKSYGARVHTLRWIANNASIYESGPAEVYQALCRGELQQYIPTVPIPCWDSSRTSALLNGELNKLSHTRKTLSMQFLTSYAHLSSISTYRALSSMWGISSSLASLWAPP